MKRIILAITLSLGLAGCGGGASLPSLSAITTGISLVTKSIANPVTKQDEVQAELAIDAAVSVLRGYKKACAEGTADKPCRANIAAIQAYTIKMPPLLIRLRNFVDHNDQINAVVAYNELAALYVNFKNTASDLGYNVGNLP